MIRRAFQVVFTVVRGIGRGLRARPKTFLATAFGVFVLNLFLPVVVLSLARRPVDFFTFNPWLSRLPEWLASKEIAFNRKIEFVSQMAIAWFSADSPVEGVEWGFVVDVPTLTWFLLASLLFGAYFALWYHRRDQARRLAWGPRLHRQGGVAGAFTSVLGFTTVPCSVTGCGVPVLPVVGLAMTGVSSSTLRFFSDSSRIAFLVILVAVSVGVAYYGWLVGAAPAQGPRAPERADRR